ncbi:hypothetical protein SAY87_009883 [Trapa incisa]|uniref:FCP1 homology domain-containing protein n=1 Tax=Trapa incisa TaxID=236973 RepID=A0AAN7JX68_9MYRT|nr:hypothetical protein SAY87_009883 [Trapa incisa]
MPALKMNTKLVSSCDDEEPFMSECRDSRMVRKRKHSVAMKSHSDRLEMTKACQSGYSEVEVMAKETALDEPSIGECNGGDEFTSQEHQLSATSAKMMDSLHPLNSETPFCQPLGENCKSDDSGYVDIPYDTQMSIGNCDSKSHNSSSPESSHESSQCISEVTAAALPSDDASGLGDIIRISFSEFECAEPNMILDVTESCILVSSVDDVVDIPTLQDRPYDGELLTKSDISWFHLVAHQAKPSNQAPCISRPFNLDETDSLDGNMFIRSILDLSDLESSSLPALLPKETCKKKSVTLVLDLDETLIHSTTEPCTDADFTFRIFFNMEEHTVYVRKRPFLKAFLERVSDLFMVVIFTASESVYAEQLLDILDPESKFFSRRCYRDSCMVIDGNYMKDLTILGVDLAKCAIIDNSPQVFQLQVNNGIPISSWFDDPSDYALMSLLPFLETLVDSEDVRPIIAKKFGLQVA